VEANRIYVGDCLEVMREWADGCVDCIVTSPPYNLLNSSGNGMHQKFRGSRRNSKWHGAALVEGYGDYKDNMPEGAYVGWQHLCLHQMYRLLKPTGAIFYNHKWRVQDGRLQERREILDGLPVRQIIIWQRAGGFNFNKGYFVPTYEVIYLIAGPEFELQPGTNALGDVWSITQEYGNPHPAPFPEELARRCIAAGSPPNGIVLDPFLGSGTTAVAAERLGRQWVGIELSPEYAEMARKRTAQMGLFTEEIDA
jgi:site-specific DNA-methyltransferase (adenine-specific)